MEFLGLYLHIPTLYCTTLKTFQAYGSSIQMWSAKLESRLIKLEEVVACTLAEKEESVCVICVVYRLEQNYAKLKLECDDLQVGACNQNPLDSYTSTVPMQIMYLLIYGHAYFKLLFKCSH